MVGHACDASGASFAAGMVAGNLGCCSGTTGAADATTGAAAPSFDGSAFLPSFAGLAATAAPAAGAAWEACVRRDDLFFSVSFAHGPRFFSFLNETYLSTFITKRTVLTVLFLNSSNSRFSALRP